MEADSRQNNDALRGEVAVKLTVMTKTATAASMLYHQNVLWH